MGLRASQGVIGVQYDPDGRYRFPAVATVPAAITRFCDSSTAEAVLTVDELLG